MTAAAPTADQEDLLSLVLDSTSTEQLARQLATRTAEQCARMLHALKDFLSTLSRRAGVGAPKVHLTMLVAALETTPVQVASVLDLFACSELSRNREALDAVTASLIARGPQWCERLASHLLSRRDRRIEALAPVLRRHRSASAFEDEPKSSSAALPPVRKTWEALLREPRRHEPSSPPPHTGQFSPTTPHSTDFTSGHRRGAELLAQALVLILNEALTLG